MERKSRGQVTISLEEFEYLKEQEENLKKLLASDKCVEYSKIYWHDRGYECLINPDPEVKEIIENLKKELEVSKEKWRELYRGNNKKIRIWDIGKTIDQIV